jgi:hypothetical protein
MAGVADVHETGAPLSGQLAGPVDLYRDGALSFTTPVKTSLSW